ncbi:hypothetical protein BgiBS90_002200 [Biomphalaria glabrata]|nr:hypothetical protein BgiBS90_002200 [Biomphalaria glabrata]
MGNKIDVWSGSGESMYWGVQGQRSPCTGESRVKGVHVLRSPGSGESMYWGVQGLESPCTGESSVRGVHVLGSPLSGESMYWGVQGQGSPCTGESRVRGVHVLGQGDFTTLYVLSEAMYWQERLTKLLPFHRC